MGISAIGDKLCFSSVVADLRSLLTSLARRRGG